MTGNWKVGRGMDWRPHVPCRGMFSGNPGTSLEEKKLNIEFYLANLGEWGGWVGGGYLDRFLLGMCHLHLRTPTQL